MRSNFRTNFLAVATLFLFSSCGGDSANDSSTAAPESEATAVDSTPMGTASITGSITFLGTAPEMPRIRQDRECSGLNEMPVMAETVIVNENGMLKNVFVHVTEGLGEYSFTPPAEPVVFDQRGCTYSPHVFGIQVGQDLKILNSDPLLHNIHALAKENRPFNFGMPNKGDERIRSFRVSEVMMKIKCDVHPWMGGYAGVVDHPFYDVSGDDGGFMIENLPPGEYVIEAWHEEYGTATQNVTVADSAQVSIGFEFGAGTGTG